MNHRRRGMTLLEALASITLCGLLLAALASMASSLAHAARIIEHTYEWETSADALLRAIHDDIACGWNPDGVTSGGESRVSANGGALRITSYRTLHRAATITTYQRMSGADGASTTALERRVDSALDSSSASIVLGGVDAFVVEVKAGALNVHLSSVEGAVRNRRIPLAGKDAP